jgi:hypothetical protein
VPEYENKLLGGQKKFLEPFSGPKTVKTSFENRFRGFKTRKSRVLGLNIAFGAGLGPNAQSVTLLSLDCFGVEALTATAKLRS